MLAGNEEDRRKGTKRTKVGTRSSTEGEGRGQFLDGKVERCVRQRYVEETDPYLKLRR